MKFQASPDESRAGDSRASQPGPNPIGPGDLTEESKPGAWYLPKLAVALANSAVCRARRKKPGGLVYCLVSNAYACPFGERVDYDLFCCHPDRENIILRTEAHRDK